MKVWRSALLVGASALAASQALAQGTGQSQAAAGGPTTGDARQSASSQGAPPQDTPPSIGETAEPVQDAIVVTGIRSSLERAAEIKRNAVQVVDSIVAEDIGKLPDPTTAAALQRVPGVQVQNDRNNELSGVKIRGLGDIQTTVDGREVFTTNGRGFDLKDLPAGALARVDVYKSQTADLIEGGVAGAIDLKLNKPFNFHKPTFVLSARENYGVKVGRGGPSLGALATDRFDTGFGEIGVLVNATYSHMDTARSQSNMTDRRSSGAAPLNTPGYLIPQVIQNMPNIGSVTRKQVNASLQWQATPSLQAYVDGLYTYFRTTAGFAGFNPQPFTRGTSITDVVPTDNCFTARVNAAGNNPKVVTDADGNETLQPFTVQTLCDIKSATFKNIVVNQNSASDRLTQKNKLAAGGLRFERDRTKATLDIAYQTSRSFDERINAEVGQRVPWVKLVTDDDNGERVYIDPSYPLNRETVSLRNSFNQNFTLATGSLFQARLDGEREFGGILNSLQAGIRYARREAVRRNVQQTTKIPYGNVGTPTEADARLVSSLPLSPDFLGIIGYAPRVNDGTYFLGVSPAFLRSEEGRNELRGMLGLPLSQPAYDPTHQFDAQEKTYAGYLQAKYEVPLGGDIAIDGVVGVRAIQTDRTISTYIDDPDTGITPVRADTSDFDLLPSATARVQFPGGFQTRFSYSRTMHRPGFGSLNPTVALVYVGNVFLINHGSAGNPDLKPEKSDSYDATAEYYFGNGFLALTGYYRTIKDRVVNAANREEIEGEEFLITRPRNVGEAELKGVEISGQYFFDFLPGALSGFGVLGAFTYADSKIKGEDQLTGYPLQGVSKYNYTVGGIYDKDRLSVRVVYTFRSRYYVGDQSGKSSLRPIDPDRVDDVFVPTLLNYVRPAGRLDFSVGYDVTDQLRLDFGGSNILGNQTKQYFGQKYLNSQVFGDETTYTIGARVRF